MRNSDHKLKVNSCHTAARSRCEEAAAGTGKNFELDFHMKMVRLVFQRRQVGFEAQFQRILGCLERTAGNLSVLLVEDVRGYG